MVARGGSIRWLRQLVYRAMRLYNRGLGHGVGCSVGASDHNVANRLPCINPWATGLSGDREKR